MSSRPTVSLVIFCGMRQALVFYLASGDYWTPHFKTKEDGFGLINRLCAHPDISVRLLKEARKRVRRSHIPLTQDDWEAARRRLAIWGCSTKNPRQAFVEVYDGRFLGLPILTGGRIDLGSVFH